MLSYDFGFAGASTRDELEVTSDVINRFVLLLRERHSDPLFKSLRLLQVL